MEQLLQNWGPLFAVIGGLLYFERRLARVETHIETLLVLAYGKDKNDE